MSHRAGMYNGEDNVVSGLSERKSDGSGFRVLDMLHVPLSRCRCLFLCVCVSILALCDGSDLRANTRASRSSRHVIAALQGKSPSDVEDDRSLASTVRVGAEDDYEHERGGSGEQHERLLSGSGTKKKTSKSVRSSKKEKHKADQANRAAGEGADDEGSDIAAGRGEHGRGTDAAPPGAASARYYEETAMEGGAEKPRRRRVRKAV